MEIFVCISAVVVSFVVGRYIGARKIKRLHAGNPDIRIISAMIGISKFGETTLSFKSGEWNAGVIIFNGGFSNYCSLKKSSDSSPVEALDKLLTEAVNHS